MKATKLMGIIQQTIKLNCPLYWKCTGVATDFETVEVSLVDLFAGNGFIVTLPFPGEFQCETEEGVRIAFETLYLVRAI